MKPHEAHDNLSRLTQVQCDSSKCAKSSNLNALGIRKATTNEITVCIFETLCGERAPVPS